MKPPSASRSIGEIAPGRILRKGGLQAGDALDIPKPIGTGILFAPRCAATTRSRRRSRKRRRHAPIGARAAAGIFAEHGATAMTDVSGFGLAGHLGEMLLASGTAAELDLAAVPIYPPSDGKLAEAGARFNAAPGKSRFGPAFCARTRARQRAHCCSIRRAAGGSGLQFGKPRGRGPRR